MAKSKLKRAAAGDRGSAPPGSGYDPIVSAPAVHAEAAPQPERAANDSRARDGSGREAREARIRERAYRRAGARGFAPGRELEDGLAAEAADPGDDATDTSR